MSQVLTLAKSPQLSKNQNPFLQEFIKQIRLSDTFSKYRTWSNESLVNQLIISHNKEAISSKNLNFHPLNQLVTNAFYNAIGETIKNITGHSTNTFVHLRNKEFSSAVITCGGVLVLYTLIWGYKSLHFPSLQELIESAETNIHNAVSKASLYLDFV
ncbi:conserved hypothetical protein [Hyella patelloides LEGE 07179]|uniref:Uncharacterized protein n=1 Tax=Hyella patelloides LEGE 07179 TaxID=945734 RepID=A0A563W0Z4_9CYAN|nr:DUF269 domain-containing protein [Hyella patelloides]VEP17358.1 conserved hypothetical protein [Hyella patelloides LEGE 07179]